MSTLRNGVNEPRSLRYAVHHDTGAMIVHADDYTDVLRLFYASLELRRFDERLREPWPTSLPMPRFDPLDLGPPAFASIGADS